MEAINSVSLLDYIASIDAVIFAINESNKVCFASNLAKEKLGFSELSEISFVNGALFRDSSRIPGDVRILQSSFSFLKLVVLAPATEEQKRSDHLMGCVHDIANMLLTVRCNVDLIRDLPQFQIPDAIEALSAIDQASERASDLCIQGLEFARGKKEVRSTLPLCRVVDEVVSMVRSSSPATVEVDYLQAEEVMVLALNSELVQIALNLIVNARHALYEEGGIIRVRSGHRGNSACLVVEDTGKGMSEEIKDKIFSHGFSTRGSGIGLSTVKRIVDSLGGEIKVESQLGRGSRFEVYLPGIKWSEFVKQDYLAKKELEVHSLESHSYPDDESSSDEASLEDLDGSDSAETMEADELDKILSRHDLSENSLKFETEEALETASLLSTADTSSTSLASVTNSASKNQPEASPLPVNTAAVELAVMLVAEPEAVKPRILLVDDEDGVRSVVERGLKIMGYDVLSARNGQEGKEIYLREEGKFDVVLLDMIMPEIPGDQLFFELQKINPQIKALMCTGFVSDERATRVLNAGGAGMLRKPFSLEELGAKIKSCL